MKNQLSTSATSAIISLMLLVSIPTPAYSVKQKPPDFSFGNEPRNVLRSYPLGTINEQVAFAHHGGPIRKEVLPNGNQGWIYQPGLEFGVPNIYVLQFSGDGVVIDVLHKDYRDKLGNSALQLQYLIDKNPMERILGSAPGR